MPPRDPRWRARAVQHSTTAAGGTGKGKTMGAAGASGAAGATAAAGIAGIAGANIASAGCGRAGARGRH